MINILLTGNKGTIGTVVTSNLLNHQFTFASRPEVDVTNYLQLKNKMKGSTIVIHLAWHMKDDWDKEKIYTYNNLMTQNIYEAALENKVKKVIMASSVHVDNFYSWNPEKGYMNSNKKLAPTTLYGQSKVYEENLGRIYAQNGIEIICLRLGAINKENVPPAHETNIWLSHGDFTKLLKKCINAKIVPGRFTALYAVSNNEGRIHDYTNPFGWEPKDTAQTFIIR